MLLPGARFLLPRHAGLPRLDRVTPFLSFHHFAIVLAKGGRLSYTVLMLFRSSSRSEMLVQARGRVRVQRAGSAV